MEGSMIAPIETTTEDTGEFVRLVWLIESVRNGRNCTMNELISHAKKFFTIEAIQFKNTHSLSVDALMNHIDKVKVKRHED